MTQTAVSDGSWKATAALLLDEALVVAFALASRTPLGIELPNPAASTVKVICYK